MKILITGASGLVGGCLLRDLACIGEVVGTFDTRLTPGLEPLDITDRKGVQQLIAGGGFTHVVHAAAIRSPDVCLEDPEKAYRVNALAVEYVTEAAREAGARLCQISTDYVFPGTHPPYREKDLPAPVNLYGRTKLAGEYAARCAPESLIVRITAQWSLNLAEPRNFASQLAGRLREGERVVLDDEIVRYYTLSEDVARAVRFLLEQEVTGIVHVTASQKTTKYDFARRLARALGVDERLVEQGPVPTAGDVRPHDTHLATDRYDSLGGPALTDIDTALGQLTSSA